MQRCGKPASNEQNVENLKHQLPLISRFGNQGEFFLLLPRESTHSGWRVQTSKTTSMITMVIGECINFLIQRNFVFRSKGNLAKQIGWYVLAFCVITCIAFVGMLFLFRPVACRCNSMHFFLRSHLYFMKMPPFRLSGMGAYIRADGGCFKRYGFLCSGFSQRLWQDAQLPPQPSPFQPPFLEIHTTASANRTASTSRVIIPRSVNILKTSFPAERFRLQYTRFCPGAQPECRAEKKLKFFENRACNLPGAVL